MWTGLKMIPLCVFTSLMVPLLPAYSAAVNVYKPTDSKITQYSQPAPLVIRGGNVFDSNKGIMRWNKTIIIRNGRIESISSSMKLPQDLQGVKIIDARGKFIIPGLIDAHVHVVHHSAQPQSHHVTADEVLPLFLANGVTSIRTAGDPIVAQTLVAHYASAHPEICPTIFLCSPLIDADPPFHPAVAARINDPAQVPAFVDDMVAWGVTTLKLYVSVNHEVFYKVIEEGHKHGLTVTAHLGGIPAQAAILDGIDCLEHIWGASYYAFDVESQKTMNLDNPVCKDLIESMAKNKVKLVPTLVEFEALLLQDQPNVYNNPALKHMPERAVQVWNKRAIDPATLEQRRKEFNMYKELTGMLYRGGVKLLAGTDTYEPFVVPGYSLHRELELLVESGLPPSAALQAATINVAEVLHQTDNIGSVEVGKRADLVMLDANPLADIKNIRRINRVVHGGLECIPKNK
ncbi:MAG: amidohydrolase family protein [Armatimonadota bacterium]